MPDSLVIQGRIFPAHPLIKCPSPSSAEKTGQPHPVLNGKRREKLHFLFWLTDKRNSQSIWLSHVPQKKQWFLPAENISTWQGPQHRRLFISQGHSITRSTASELQFVPRQILEVRPSPAWANAPGRKSSEGCSSTRKKQSEQGDLN